MMDTTAHMAPRSTATIYEFPKRSRAAGTVRHADKPSTVADIRLHGRIGMDFGSWYHQDAMDEEARNRIS